MVESHTEGIEPIVSACLLSRAEKCNEHAVRIHEQRPWCLPNEPESECVDVEALGLVEIADPEPEVTYRIIPKPHGCQSFLEIACAYRPLGLRRRRASSRASIWRAICCARRVTTGSIASSLTSS